jgi:methyltransferase
LLLLGGNALAWWGVATMGWRNAGGAMESFATGGPYRWFDHPQYAGDILILVGWPLLAGSWTTFVAAAPGVVCFLLARIPEERALRRHFGRARS